jgi:hypothetical protein
MSEQGSPVTPSFAPTFAKKGARAYFGISRHARRKRSNALRVLAAARVPDGVDARTQQAYSRGSALIRRSTFFGEVAHRPLAAIDFATADSPERNDRCRVELGLEQHASDLQSCPTGSSRPRNARTPART